jgi:response regulator RpfG family c-di-GMP phosphodiesterase
MDTNKAHILYVDVEINNLNSFKAAFRVHYEVHTAISGAEAIKMLDDKNIHVIITDQRMPGMTGVEFLESVIPHHPDVMRILLTGYSDHQATIDAVNKGKIFAYLAKPWIEADLIKTIDESLAIYNQRQAEKEKTALLSTSNTQLEFLLRQKLLS